MWKVVSRGSFSDSTSTPQTSDSNQQTDTLPAPVPSSSQGHLSVQAVILGALLSIFLSLVGLGALAFLLMCLAVQLFWLLAPFVGLYSAITSETASWRGIDPTQPCPQLWKDGLEDELWWF